MLGDEDAAIDDGMSLSACLERQGRWENLSEGGQKCVLVSHGFKLLRSSVWYGVKVTAEDRSGALAFQQPLATQPEALQAFLRYLSETYSEIVSPHDLEKATQAKLALNTKDTLPYSAKTLLAGFYRATRLNQVFFTTSDVTGVLESVGCETSSVSTTLNQMAKTKSPLVRKVASNDEAESKAFELTDLGDEKIEDLIFQP